MDTIVKEFQFAVKETAPCVAEITVTAGPETTAKYCRAAREEYRKQAKLPGFRPGKVPTQILEAQFGSGIRASAQENLFRKSVDAAIKESGYDATRYTDIISTEPQLLEANKEFKYVLKVEYFPKITLPDLKSISVTLEAVTVADEDVDNTIKEWLQYKSKLEKQDRAAQAEDLLQVSYSCDAPEEFLADTFKGHHLLKAEKTWLILRQPEMIPGATAALAGVSAGESKDFAVTFPEDHYVEELRGKSFNYHVDVIEVQGYITPELTDDLAKEAGAESAEDLRKKVRENLELTKKNAAEEKCKADIFKKLTEALGDTPLPPSLLEDMKKAALQQLSSDKAKADKPQEEKDAMAAQQAKEMLCEQLIIRKISQDHAQEVAVTNEEWFRTIGAMADSQHVNIETMVNRLKSSDRLDMVSFNLTLAKVKDFLFKNADVKQA